MKGIKIILILLIFGFISCFYFIIKKIKKFYKKIHKLELHYVNVHPFEL